MSVPPTEVSSTRQSIAWDVQAPDLPDALERYLVGMADIYDISGISEHDQAHFYNRSRATLTNFGGLGEGYSVRQTLSRSPALLRRSSVDGLNLAINQTASVGDFNGRSVRPSRVPCCFATWAVCRRAGWIPSP